MQFPRPQFVPGAVRNPACGRERIVGKRAACAALGAVLVVLSMASCSDSGNASKPLSEALQDQKQREAAAKNTPAQDALSKWINSQQQANDPGAVGAMPKPISRDPDIGVPASALAGKGDGSAANAPAEIGAEQTSVPTSTVSERKPAAAPADPGAARMKAVREALEHEARTSSAPLGAFIKLSTLDMLDDGSKAAGGEAATRLDAAFSRLTPAERDYVAAWRQLHDGVEKGLDASGDMGQLTRAAGEFARSARAWEPLRISKATLCTKVEGFGVYTELTRYGDVYKFIAGHKQKFIVYSELDRFTPAAVSRNGAQGYAVELSQDLTLYNAARDRDVVAWRRDGQVISDFSRNPRRDFFVVQIIELPETLSIGGYTLKVSVSDRNAGGAGGFSGSSSGGAVAESVIPIEIVADASALRE